MNISFVRRAWKVCTSLCELPSRCFKAEQRLAKMMPYGTATDPCSPLDAVALPVTEYIHQQLVVAVSPLPGSTIALSLLYVEKLTPAENGYRHGPARSGDLEIP